eukprot:g32717.t1
MLMRSESLQSTFVFNDFCVVRFRVVEKPTEQALVSWSRAVGPPAAHESFAIPASAAAAAYNQKRYVMDLARLAAALKAWRVLQSRNRMLRQSFLRRLVHDDQLDLFMVFDYWHRHLKADLRQEDLQRLTLKGTWQRWRRKHQSFAWAQRTGWLRESAVEQRQRLRHRALFHAWKQRCRHRRDVRCFLLKQVVGSEETLQNLAPGRNTSATSSAAEPPGATAVQRGCWCARTVAFWRLRCMAGGAWCCYNGMAIMTDSTSPSGSCTTGASDTKRCCAKAMDRVVFVLMQYISWPPARRWVRSSRSTSWSTRTQCTRVDGVAPTAGGAAAPCSLTTTPGPP